jgi:hypothetical protein
VTEPGLGDAGPPLRCHNCGGNRITVPNHSTDESIVTCTSCGADLGRWGTLRLGILEVAKKAPAAEAAAAGPVLAREPSGT